MLLSELSATSRNWAGESPTGAMSNALRAFASAALLDSALLRDAAASLDRQTPGSAAWIAVALGAAVERGASAEISGPAVLELVRDWLPKLPAADDPAAPVPAPTPAQARLMTQFQFVCRAAVTHLARLPDLRRSLGADAALLERLDDLGVRSYGARWLYEALVKSSGTLVLLHPDSRSGLRLRYENVSNCFHLFSLLQTAVGTRLPEGREPDAAIASAARGQGSDAVRDEAWWDYARAKSTDAAAFVSLAGEQLVREIPRIDGQPVILLRPLEPPGRSWDSAFFAPHLEAMPADAKVDSALTADEASSWLDRLKGSRGRPWWKIWG